MYRYHCEAALEDDARRIHTQVVLDVLSGLLQVDWLETSRESKPSVPLSKIVSEAIIGAEIGAEVPTEVLLQEAQELAQADNVSALKA